MRCLASLSSHGPCLFDEPRVVQAKAENCQRLRGVCNIAFQWNHNPPSTLIQLYVSLLLIREKKIIHVWFSLIAKSSFHGRRWILINTQYPEMICILNDLIGYRFGTHVGVEFIKKRFAFINGVCSSYKCACGCRYERMAHWLSQYSVVSFTKVKTVSSVLTSHYYKASREAACSVFPSTRHRQLACWVGPCWPRLLSFAKGPKTISCLGHKSDGISLLDQTGLMEVDIWDPLVGSWAVGRLLAHPSAISKLEPEAISKPLVVLL
jgi:hypothetical protein